MADKFFSEFIIDLIHVSGGQLKCRILGHHVKQFDGSGPVGGKIMQISTDNLGRIQVDLGTLSSILNCGHIINKTEQIGGYCQICARAVCRNCLAVCDLTGLSVCRRHYVVVAGVIVSTRAQKGLWKRKVKKIAKARKELLDAKAQLPVQK